MALLEEMNLPCTPRRSRTIKVWHWCTWGVPEAGGSYGRSRTLDFGVTCDAFDGDKGVRGRLDGRDTQTNKADGHDPSSLFHHRIDLPTACHRIANT